MKPAFFKCVERILACQGKEIYNLKDLVDLKYDLEKDRRSCFPKARYIVECSGKHYFLLFNSYRIFLEERENTPSSLSLRLVILP